MSSTDSAIIDLKHRLETLLGDRLDRLVLFGSRARGDWDADSDTDIAIIVRDLDHDLKLRVLDEVASVELDHLSPLSTLLLSTERFRYLLGRERRIALDIERDGIPL